jgi:proteasome lid subunit RPN8/RPN11/cell division protein FtsL
MDDLGIVIFPEEDPIPNRKPPLEAGSYYLWGEPQREEVVVICSQKVLTAITTYSQSTSSEVGGVLVGNAFRFEGKIYVHAIEFISAPTFSRSQSSRTHFNFSPEAWTTIYKEKDQKYPNMRIVGWFHSHPGHGVFLSGDDLKIHREHFNQHWHIALVYDPFRHEGDFFVWQDQRIIKSPGFYEVSAKELEHSKITWRNWEVARNKAGRRQMQEAPMAKTAPITTIKSEKNLLIVFFVFFLIIIASFMFYILLRQQSFIEKQQERQKALEIELIKLEITNDSLSTQIADLQATNADIHQTLDFVDPHLTATFTSTFLPTDTKEVHHSSTPSLAASLSPTPSQTGTPSLTPTLTQTPTP